MKNGDAFNAFLQETQQFLAGLQVITYYSSDLPSVVDDRFSVIVNRFMEADAEKRERFSASLNDSERSLFGIFGHRGATLAARQKSETQLLQGLVGTVIANYKIPEKRRVEVALAVYYHVARKLDLNPIELFENAAVYANEEFASKLLSFSRKPGVTLNSYGWREITTPDGVKYKFEWR
jgi:hypothetical protein